MWCMPSFIFSSGYFTYHSEGIPQRDCVFIFAYSSLLFDVFYP
nr:MAG TPA: hypothetical protein [Bacteriophage sp.]